MHKNQYPATKPFYQLFSKYFFLLVTVAVVLLYFFNRPLYQTIILEDNIAEWLTFAFLISTAVISLLIGLKIRRTYGYTHWFFMLFFAFNLLAGFEEISWGQRVAGIETTGVFAKYSDQNEINLHNFLQGLAPVKTKHFALYILFFYGVILPWLVKSGRVRFAWINKNQLIVPPDFLRGGFLIATLFMIDVPTGREEEIGEFLYSACFLLMMIHNLMLAQKSNHFAVLVPEVKLKNIPSRNEKSETQIF